jgi:SAM-dependent methyltransferase
MTTSTSDKFDLAPHLSAYWLRPESALWDTIAARRIGDELAGRQDIVEVGIGNGFFSFLMLGGRFKSAFDWFYSVDTAGFWQQSDIFDHDSGLSLSDFIETGPRTRIKVGLDHKQALLNQAGRLGFVDRLLAHDCNQPLPPMQPTSTIYSNILYWLNSPLDALHQIGESLTQGGVFVAVFPNRAFYEACASYTASDNLSRLINRGRAKHIMWHMDLPEFEREVDRRGVFEVASARRYLAPKILKIWDLGLRPLSVPLIKMANSLDPARRTEIKEEWCETLMQFAEPLLAEEVEQGSRAGGFNLVRLVRR